MEVIDDCFVAFFGAIFGAILPITSHVLNVNIPRRNTTITIFHAVSKEGTGLFTDLPSFCYRACFFVSCDSNLHANERGGMPGGAVHVHDSEKARN